MKSIYRKLCETEPTIPLFCQAWWLDAVAGESWDVVLVTKGEQVIGALPFVKRKRWFFTLLTQPKLTQALGPWVRPSQKAYPKKLAFEKEVLISLADQLAEYDFYGQNWHCSLTNWLPFYWRGFDQTTRYTYRLELSLGVEKLWSGLQENIRREIRKAKNRYNIEVRVANLEEFLKLNKMVFERQKMSISYSDELVARLDAAAYSRDARDCLVAVDSEGKLHAGVYVVRGGNTAYYLMGGSDSERRSSGAMSLVLWEAICRQPSGVEIFDFEGSMIEPIERFFRAFGARQTPYFYVSRNGSLLLRVFKAIRSLLHRDK